MSILKIIVLIYGFISVFIAGGLFFSKKDTGVRLLAIFVLGFGMETLEYLYSTSLIYSYYPEFYARYYYIIGFLYGPLLWFHLRYAYKVKQKWNYLDLLHLLPLAFAMVYIGDVFFMKGVERLNYMYDHFMDRMMPLNYARAIHQVCYGIAIVYFLFRPKSVVKRIKRIFSIVLSAIYFLTSIISSWYTTFANSWDDFLPYYFVLSTISLVLVYLLYKHPDFLESISKKYVYSTLKKTDMTRIEKKIIHGFEKEQWFLNQRLNLHIISEKTEESVPHLSQTFNTHIGESFNNYLNKHRIKYAQSLLRNKEYHNLTIEAIAIDSGFNNKVTFNKAFLKFTEKKPSAYRAEYL